MLTVKIDTGFVGGIHEAELDMSIDEWNELSDNDKYIITQEIINDYIEISVIDEEGNSIY